MRIDFRLFRACLPVLRRAPAKPNSGFKLRAFVAFLRGQAKNDKTDLQLDDHSVKKAFDSVNTDYIRGQIRERIDRCSVTVVYLSEKSATSRWVNWEIEESIKRGKGIIGNAALIPAERMQGDQMGARCSNESDRRCQRQTLK
jgi:hypothetical protein